MHRRFLPFALSVAWSLGCSTPSTGTAPSGSASAAADPAAAECAGFSKYLAESFRTVNAAVPEAKRRAAVTAPAISAWHRELADAFDAEAKKPARFTTAAVAPLEVRYKATLELRAKSLRISAEAFDKVDDEGPKKAGVVDKEADQALAGIMQDLQTACPKKAPAP